jgi:non-canonical (house-cleaning) NTP pyrophosphatase
MQCARTCPCMFHCISSGEAVISYGQKTISGISEQPMTLDETRQGAVNRAQTVSGTSDANRSSPLGKAKPGEYY